MEKCIISFCSAPMEVTGRKEPGPCSAHIIEFHASFEGARYLASDSPAICRTAIADFVRRLEAEHLNSSKP